MTTTEYRGASEKTLGRLRKALKRHDVGELRTALEAQLDAGLSQTAASAMIDLVEALPLTTEAVAAATNKVTEAGYYEHPADGRVVKVQISKQGHPYALERDPSARNGWRFVSGLITELDATRRTEAPAAPVPAEGASTDLLSKLAALAAKSA